MGKDTGIICKLSYFYRHLSIESKMELILLSLCVSLFQNNLNTTIKIIYVIIKFHR